MIKRITAMLMVVLLSLLIVACNDNDTQPTQTTEVTPVFKIGVMLASDANDSTSTEHTYAIKEAIKELNIKDNQVMWKYSVKADESCYDTAKILVSDGCDLVITNSRRHQEFIEKAADEFSDVEFVVIGGDTATTAGLDNFHNAYTDIYQARYLCGVVAGMKIKELIKSGKLEKSNYDPDGKIKIGYMGTLPSSEANSSYSAFYLGVKSVHPDVSMCVQFTNKRSNINAEIDTTNQLISQGCVIIAQHNSSQNMAAAVKTATKAGKVCYCVGYNRDASKLSDSGMLVAAKNNWEVYYKELFSMAQNDEYIKPDWIGGLEKEAVAITELTQNCCEGTQEEVDAITEAIISQELYVFDVDQFTSNGKKLNSVFVTDTDGDDVPDEDQAIFDSAFHESYFRSAPYFSLDIDGITVLN